MLLDRAEDDTMTLPGSVTRKDTALQVYYAVSCSFQTLSVLMASYLKSQNRGKLQLLCCISLETEISR